MNRPIPLKELGLDIGSVLGTFFWKTENLHYGYWKGVTPVNIENFPQAQDNFSHFILEHVPEGVQSILDVGCGSGHLAQFLQANRYEVECVSPSPYLTKRARKTLAPNTMVHECYFEDFGSSRNFDMVMFSESFQYIPVEKAMPKALESLRSGGYIFICDFFSRSEIEGKSPISGGHNIDRFQRYAKELSADLIVEKEITEETAPTIDLLDHFVQQVIAPIGKSISASFVSNYPKIAKFLAWKYKKRLEKLRFKYFENRMNSKNFAKYKTYRLFIYKKR